MYTSCYNKVRYIEQTLISLFLHLPLSPFLVAAVSSTSSRRESHRSSIAYAYLIPSHHQNARLERQESFLDQERNRVDCLDTRAKEKAKSGDKDSWCYAGELEPCREYNF